MNKKIFTFYLLLVGTGAWYILSQFADLNKFSNNIFGIFMENFNATHHFEKLFAKSPTLRERLLLIDHNLLRVYEKNRKSELKTCILCYLQKNTPVTFGLVTPVNRSLEEHVLLPILRVWENGFWVEQIVNTNHNKYSPIRINLPLGFILQSSGSLYFELLLFHQREGDFWWHGTLSQDAGINKKLKNVKLFGKESLLELNSQGAYDKIRFETVTIDGLDFNVPRNIRYFLGETSTFVECNYERADHYHRVYGKDVSAAANMFRHRVTKILSTAKAVLDNLKIPFWISSGTLLGYFRQCDIIPYSQDVDIGIFIKDYNLNMIPAFISRGFKLKHKFGRVSDGLEISFISRAIKLDIFFFYEDNNSFWNGGHALVHDKGHIRSGVKYRYTFPEFTLCWTEFLDMKLRIPCETEAYVSANYGPNWFKPIAKWHWYKDPFNVKRAGVWTADEASEVLQVF